MRRLPYRAVRCEHCRSEDTDDCQFCDGTRRVIERMNETKRLTEAMDNMLVALKRWRAAWEGLGMK